MFNPFEVTIPHIAYACLGGFIVLFGMFSLFLREKLYIGEACWAFLFGVIIGPYGADIFNPHHWGGGSEDITNTITLEFTRVVLAIGVFAIGVELPKAYMARHWKSIFFLLVPVMTWGWFVSAGLIFAFIPGLNFLSSLAVAACLTPTDPILAAAVVGGKWADKHVPAHLRHLLAAESGCNDGAAFPFLFISLYLLLDKTTSDAVQDWFLILWLYQVILGIVIGSILGFAFRHLMKFCQRYNLIDRHSYVAQYISLAMLTIGVTTLLGSDDLLAAFACGTAFAWDGFFNRQTEESVFSSVIDLLFNVAAFVYVGAWMPFSTFQNAELTLSVWRLIVIAILILLLRRLPVMIALYKWIPDIKTFREAVFSGHFGPIGIGAIFISTLANEIIHRDHNPHSHQVEMLADTIQPIVAFMVLCSITIHGLSIPSLSLGRRVHTVSRTWSRHVGAPDWTNQTRLVRRGEEIVINRDSDMERGHLHGEGKLPESRTLTSRTPSVSTPEKLHEEHPSLERHLSLPLSEGLPDAPPDETVEQEWQEGHHIVIERRAYPGDDVDVEVIDESPPSSKTSSIRRSLHLLSGLRKTTSHLEDDTGDSVEAKVAEIEEHVKHALSANADTPGAGPSRQPGEEDEEGWASDRSSSSGDQVGGEESTEAKKRLRIRTLRSHPLGSARRGRQRTSLRRSHVHSVAPEEQTATTMAAATSPTSPAESEARGRSPMYPTPSSPIGSARSRPTTADRGMRPGTADGSLRNHRIDHIKALHSSPPTREVSPSRSIRFMDEAPRSPPPEGDEDSSKTKVTFDLPSTKP
ncbi:putative Na(+)/H(+) antiporter C3A11.09 [Hypsizygus marmoreus]|uniref:Na(+)/H(+) antiporter C3A11.09 n=1 Tax=Hypsizygus marmoreus TaxID=39966 RepID=A0A369J369_HYPMA|nr:putative Na(+)/H(+) antiporter C3A11.09 [Hypsizygus marmoreus]